MVRQSARLELRLEPELRRAIEAIAEELDRSVAWVVRDALRRYAADKATPPADPPVG